jgi:hypothetical protein
MRVPAPRWRLFVLTIVACLAVAVGGFVTSTATALSPTAPTAMVITSISGDTVPWGGTAPSGAPSALVQAGGNFTMHVEFSASGAPASFSNDTTLSISAPSGTLSPSTYVVPKGSTSADITSSLSVAANSVLVTLKVTSGPAKGLSTLASQTPVFDVVSRYKVDSSNSGTTGIGGDSADTCATATFDSPVCGILLLPSGANTSVVMSLGACDKTYDRCGSTRGAVVQALANLTGLYSPTSPATLIVKCDKSLCGTGAIQNVKLNYSLSGNGTIDQVAAACPAKNTLGTAPACIDYVQSKRDGSGDTHLYLLFDQDMRTSVG